MHSLLINYDDMNVKLIDGDSIVPKVITFSDGTVVTKVDVLIAMYFGGLC